MPLAINNSKPRAGSSSCTTTCESARLGRQAGSASGKPNSCTSAGWWWNATTRETPVAVVASTTAPFARSTPSGAQVVHDGRGLAVGGGREHPPVARGAQHVQVGVEHVDAHRPVCLPVAEWRRLQVACRLRNTFSSRAASDRSKAAMYPSSSARAQLIGRFEQLRGLRLQFVEPGAGALQAALHRGSGGVEDFRGLGRGEGQHLAQDRDRALTGGEVLQARDERQPQRLPRDHHRGRIIQGWGDPHVGERLQP